MTIPRGGNELGEETDAEFAASIDPRDRSNHPELAAAALGAARNSALDPREKVVADYIVERVRRTRAVEAIGAVRDMAEVDAISTLRLMLLELAYRHRICTLDGMISLCRELYCSEFDEAPWKVGQSGRFELTQLGNTWRVATSRPKVQL